MVSPSRKLYDHDYYESSCEGFDRSVDDLSPRLSKFTDWIAPQLNGVVADVGFGRGELSIHAARMPEVDRVFSFDYSLDATIIFMQNLQREPEWVVDKVTVIVDDVVTMPKLDFEFDYVMAIDVIEHLYFEQLVRFMEFLTSATKHKIFVSTPLTKAEPNERHVWLAEKMDDLLKILPVGWGYTYLGYAGSGEDHFFEFHRV
jgi:predicted RNA methylase